MRRILLCIGALAAAALTAAAQSGVSTARYRLIRYADRATGDAWWENQRMQDIQAEEVICDLPAAAAYTVPGFRILDAGHPGKECQWTAPPNAEVFQNMRSDRTYSFTLRTRPDEWSPWTAGAELSLERLPGAPRNGRIVIP